MSYRSQILVPHISIPNQQPLLYYLACLLNKLHSLLLLYCYNISLYSVSPDYWHSLNLPLLGFLRLNGSEHWFSSECYGMWVERGKGKFINRAYKVIWWTRAISISRKAKNFFCDWHKMLSSYRPQIFRTYSQSIYFFAFHESGIIAYISRQQGSNLYHFLTVFTKAFDMLADIFLVY